MHVFVAPSEFKLKSTNSLREQAGKCYALFVVCFRTDLGLLFLTVGNISKVYNSPPCNKAQSKRY
jgi:hypothetical protein